MKKFLLGLLVIMTVFLERSWCSKGDIYVLPLQGVINPISSRFIIKHIKIAQEKKIDLIIIEMDTPGGLESAMHDMVKEILNSRVPIVSYVCPQGARAASAGVFIALASDVIAMAPSTRIGAAHPVTLGQKASDVALKKITLDLAALARSIAKKKGRNTEWAVEAVKKSSSLTEEEAKKRKVIDLIASSREDLLEKLDGFVIHKNSKKIILNTKDKKINYIKMNIRERFLHAITEPNIAYILLMFGIYGLIYEFGSGGVGLGAVVGSISLILAFLGLQALPVNLAGLLLIILGIILLILELKVQSHGILTIGGLASLLIGSFILIDAGEAVYMTISSQLIIGMVLATALFFVVALSLAIKAHMKKPYMGRVSIIGKVGTAVADIDQNEGMAFVEGENWKAQTEKEIKIKKGEKIIVKRLEGMVLLVDRLDKIKLEKGG